MSIKHDEGKVEALCRIARACAMLKERPPLAVEEYRPIVIRVLEGTGGESPLAKAIAQAAIEIDAARAGVDLKSWSVVVRRDGSDVRVEAAHSPECREEVLAVVGAAIGAARAA